MNVFVDLRGPEFLWFYALLMIVALIITAALRRLLDGGAALQSPASVVSDPYLIAQLRGGSDETLRVVVMSLVDRDLIECRGTVFQTKAGVEPAHGRRPIEQDVLRHCRGGADWASLARLSASCQPYDERLRELQLIPDAAIKSRRGALFGVMLIILGGIGVIRISIGINRDRPVLFLVILTALSVVFLAKAAFPRRTKHGTRLLADIRRLFAGLQQRAGAIQRGGATTELALLAAVFGVTAVPLTIFPSRAHLFPPQQAATSSTSSCSSSSSSCGSSCGGGCGGGGCGGCGG